VSVIRKLLIGSVRLLVTAGLLWALLAHVDFSHVKEIVGHLSLPLLAAGAMALLATSPFGVRGGTSSWQLRRPLPDPGRC
jgi:hypothetical protein